MKILLVEDDESLIAVLIGSLTLHNYVVDAVKDGELGWEYSSTFEYDLIVLDIQLPKLDGISLCQRLRGEGYTTPILLLTALDTSTAKVQGLDAGADDYMVKPFDVAELCARIRALLRRSSSNPLPLMTWGDLLLNPSTCDVSYNGKLLTLTTKEYRLLEILLWDSQHVFSTEEILDRLWSSEEFPAEATVRSHIRRLRHKLIAAGAPSDFIATVHGRGYYLQAPVREMLSQDNASEETMHALRSSILERDRPATRQLQQAQYLALLHETWIASQPDRLAQMQVFDRVVQELRSNSLTPQLQVQAQQTAHKLAGSMGTFGLDRGMQLARQLEHLLDNLTPIQTEHAAGVETLAAALAREITNTISIQSCQLPPQDSPTRHLPLLLAIGFELSFTQPLVHAAVSFGLRTAIAPTLEIAKNWLESGALPGQVDRLPQAILLQLPAEPSSATDTLNWLQMLAQYYPELPILVVGDRHELMDRLEVVRRGGKMFLESSIAPEQAVSIVGQFLTRATLELKVMIVDDDRDWLRTLPLLLRPWGFKVTTLAEPQEFWIVLQAVMPDVLVLDVNMPHINGFELCQVLRSDPHWQQLPVIFLSVLSDRQTQNRAFAVGGDDYLCKPAIATDLANRIFNRLQRVRF